ncbi:unnamed protein product [Linum trigynum]
MSGKTLFDNEIGSHQQPGRPPTILMHSRRKVLFRSYKSELIIGDERSVVSWIVVPAMGVVIDEIAGESSH